MAEKTRKHSPAHIRKKADNQAAFIVSHPDRADVGYSSPKEFLGNDINVTLNEVAKIVTIKTFDHVEQVPTANRMAEVEAALQNFLPRTEYANIEAQQRIAFEKLIADVDTKDLDVDAFMNYWSQAAKLSDIERLQTAIDAEKTLNLTQQGLIATIQEELKNRVHSEENHVLGEIFKNEAGKNYATVPVPADLYVHNARIYRDGLKMSHEAYTTSSDGTITFDIEITSDEKIDVEVAFKKK